MNNVQTLKGFRDILPQEKRVRNFVATSIANTFAQFGFAPLETPTLEYADLLLGKYGTEADQLVYTFDDRGGRSIGLRYDQTLPTARVLAQYYQNELPKFFRRYQMQNVFRADKPQRGRYREFTQCDCDIFGTSSPIADAEVIAVFYATYNNLGLPIVIEMNDRQTLLSTVRPFATEDVDMFSIIQSIDKLDKQTPTEVAAELNRKGLSQEATEQALSEIENAEKSDYLAEIENNCYNLGVPQSALVVNPKLARGLDYYTGLIFEGRIPEYTVGSVGGGGRYDQLIESLSGVSIPAVGFGIGFDRTVEAAVQLGVIPQSTAIGAQVMVALFAEELVSNALTTAQALRQAGIATELYPEVDKLGKQFKLADQKGIPFVVLVGEQEVADGTVTVKNMETGEQETDTLANIISKLG